MGDNEEKRMMRIECDDGSSEEVEVILAFEFKDNKKEYVVYTKNEKDEEGNITLYISNVDRTNAEIPKLMGVDDEYEWERIQEVLRELAKPDEDYYDFSPVGNDRQNKCDLFLQDDEINELIPLSIHADYKVE